MERQRTEEEERISKIPSSIETEKRTPETDYDRAGRCRQQE